jgi:hypothetical protein
MKPPQPEAHCPIEVVFECGHGTFGYLVDIIPPGRCLTYWHFTAGDRQSSSKMCRKEWTPFGN